MSQHAKSRHSSSPSKSAHSTYSMHKGTGPIQRKRKPHNQSPTEASKKRRVARNPSEAQSGQGLRDGMVPRLTERQQLALAMEESKKAAAALQAKDRQASRPMDSEEDDSDCQSGSDSEQDSVSEDESAVKPHRRASRAAHPAHSLTSQHSDDASQLGQHDDPLCAKSGRLETLSGGSKQSQSTSSKLRLTADSSGQIASSLQHVDSDADSHPRQTDSQPGRSDGVKRSSSVERQRTSDLSSRDVLDTAEDRGKDESQSQDVADVRLPLEDGMDLLDKRTQRLALRKALSHTMSLQPESLCRAETTELASRLHKLPHTKSDLNGSSALSKHAMKALKVRVKAEGKPQQQLNGLESLAMAEDAQHRKGKAGTQTPRDQLGLSSEATPRSRSGQHSRAFDRSHHLMSHPSVPMAQLIESDLFGDFSPKKGSALAAAVSSPRALNALGPALQRLEALHSQDAATQPQLAHKTGLKVTLKQHRLAVSDAAKAAGSEAAAAKVVSQEAPATVSTAAEQPATPAAKPSPSSAQADVDAAEQPAKQQEAGFAAFASPSVKALKRKPGKPGRPRTVRKASTFAQEVMASPASDPRCQALAEQNACDTSGPSATPMAPPETDAQTLEPSTSAAKGRPRGRKFAKQASINSLASRRLRSTFAEDDSVKPSFQSFDSRKQKGSVLTGACNLLVAEHKAWLAAFRPNTGTAAVASSGPRSKPAQDEPQADTFSDIDASRRETSRLLHDAATSALSDLKQQHELEGKLLTSSMMVSSKTTAADRPFSRRQSSKEQASSADQPTQQQPGAFAAACAHLWAPLQRNRDADKLYWSRKFSREELTPQDVRSPRRSSSHRTYDSGWDDLQARQSSEIEILESFQQWCSN